MAHRTMTSKIFAMPPVQVWQRTQSFPGAINTARNGSHDSTEDDDDLAQHFTVLRWQGQELPVYTSGDTLIVLNEDLTLHCTIPVAPHLRQHRKGTLQGKSSDVGIRLLGGLCCDSTRGFIYTWTGSEVVCFAPVSAANSRARTSSGPSWKLYGTLSLSTGSQIQCLDVSSSQDERSSDETLLLLATLESLELWIGDLFGPVPIWTRKWSRPHEACVRAILSSERTFVAWHSLSSDSQVHVQALARDYRLQGLPQSLKQPRGVRWIQWCAQNDDSLYVVGAEGVVRIWSPVLDEPTWFQLCYSTSIREPTRLVRGRNTDEQKRSIAWKTAFAIVPIQETQEDSRRSIESARSNDDSRSVRARRQRTRVTSESILWLSPSGQIKSITVDGLDRKPPELLAVQRPAVQGAVDLKGSSATRWDRLCVLSTRDRPQTCLLVSVDTLQPVASQGQIAEPPTYLGGADPIETLEYDADRRQLTSFACGRQRARRLQLGRSGVFRHLDTRTAAGGALLDTRTSTPRIHIPQEDPLIIAYLAPGKESWVDVALPPSSAQKAHAIFVGEVQAKGRNASFLVITSDESTRLIGIDDDQKASVRAETSMLKEMSNTILSSPQHVHSRSSGSEITIDVIGKDGNFASWRWASGQSDSTWTRQSSFPTGLVEINRVVDIDSNRTALSDCSGQLSIWDKRSQEFTEGPEYRVAYADNPISDIAQITDELGTPCLGVITQREIQILSPATLVLDSAPTWRVSNNLPTSISAHGAITALCSAGHGAVAIAHGNQLHIYRSKKRDEPMPEIRTLPEYHPRTLTLVLMGDRLDLAATIGGHLRKALKAQAASFETEQLFPYEDIDALEYLKTRSDLLPDAAEHLPDTSASVNQIGLSRAAQHQLQTLLSYIAQMLDSRLQTDTCGKRYLALLALRIQPTTSPSDANQHLLSAGAQVVWAYYSRTQQALVDQTIRATSNGKLRLVDADRSGLFLWLYDKKQLRLQAEAIAANEYVASDRNPIACSLIYFALGKKSTVFALWKQAHGHAEQGAMLKFLANDFSQPRWQSAAKKNAYALLSKQRFEYAAAFFVLAGSYRDAINVCVRNHQSLSLGILLARLLEPSDELLVYAVQEHILPVALQAGNRWLAHWALMTIKNYPAAIQAIVLPVRHLAEILERPQDRATLDWGIPDPTLSLLLSHVKSRSRTAQHYRDTIAVGQEYRFVLYSARGYWRQGHPSLALRLLATWDFSREVVRKPAAATPVAQTPATLANDTPPPIPVERSEKATVFSAGAMRQETQGAMDFDMNAFF